MNAQQRRACLLEALQTAEAPVSAASLAARFQVSRQIIVGDVALLRAAGNPIEATPRGYVVTTAPQGLIRTVACCHSSQDMERELNLMVDNGCTVLDVVVEHPVYGQLSGGLHIASRYDVSQFLRRVNDADAKPISGLTHGIHLHTLSCPSEDAYLRVKAALAEAGMLVEE
jgi:transcriptional regulator of NAD metabolism